MFDEYYDFRRQLVDALARDLIGPSEEREIIHDKPITQYISGILYPLDSGSIDASLDIDAPDDDETTFAEPPIALANVRYPSSMGLTFAVDVAVVKRIVVEIRAARYVFLGEDLEAKAELAGLRRAGKQERWQREPITVNPIEVIIDRPQPGIRYGVASGLELFCRVRAPDRNGAVPVTLVLLNTTRTKPGQSLRDADSVFQPEIRVSAPSISNGAFVERPITGVAADDEDIRSYRLLYRHAKEFAVGHGCSVLWDLAPIISDRVPFLRTTFAPQAEVKLADSNPGITSQALRMTFLSRHDRDEVVTDLTHLSEGYEEWIEGRRHEVAALSQEHRFTAGQHLEACDEALRRMRRGINVLASDGVAWRAFKLANEAMLQQRARTVWLRSGRPGGGPDELGDHEWYPFQLAFILICLEGIVDPESQDRVLADLLWFPTGGGKTEAYLGLIAFTVFLRRLRNRDGGGVTALMRYTLRLLTIQQFERAALLICCCEEMRIRNPELGDEPISIGLWVGEDASPNNIKDARAALERLKQGGTVDKGNPIQIRVCPWCGAELDWKNYYIRDLDPKRLVVGCRNKDCDFERGLPVFVVDEDVYRFRPTLIIATVDKFAGLARNDQCADLFNLQNAGRPRQLPPELIIQDELHLISGPLGTLVGLYETAIDLLCTTSTGVRPKVIASTATIRRASQQTKALFSRPVRQFPPSGLDARDSYFAVEAPPEERGTRLYVGLMAPGTSQTTLLVRAYAALLQNAADLDARPDVKDPYWTLLGYFNSLRVLGGARMQVQDDVQDRIELLSGRSGTEQRAIEQRIELTSRESSGDIPKYLRQMAEAYPSEAALDVILATNMISVGMDVNRLGLMAVMGQPQSTSEYIQSTSRVGRQFPGLVAVLFNSARSRDRSHYESFLAYHSALYREVESTSVTPFSARARDRALHAVLVALVRLLVPEFRSNQAAASAPRALNKIEPIKRLILDRVRQVAPEELEATETQLDELLNAWAEFAEASPGLAYRGGRDSSQALLLDPALDGLDFDQGFPTMFSLRDVDPESSLYVVR